MYVLFTRRTKSVGDEQDVPLAHKKLTLCRESAGLRSL